jgi:hypothetical protein
MEPRGTRSGNCKPKAQPQHIFQEVVYMKIETIALVFMDDEQDSFFIENPPKGNPEKWISRFADKNHVEHVKVVMRGERVSEWMNPNVSVEE